MYLTGMAEDEMLDRFASFTRSPTYSRMRRMYALYRRRAGAPKSALQYFRRNGLAFLSNNSIAAIDDETFERFVEHFIGADTSIDLLGRPFATVATDLTTGREVILGSGPLHFALRATCAVPGLFEPQALDTRRLVDGSTISEVPVRGACSLGLTAPVLAVYLVRPEQEVAGFSTSAEVFTRTTAIVHSELVREQLRHAPELITAFVEEIAWLDFRRAEQTVEIGFAAASAYVARTARARLVGD
jgi:NTE family protein